MSPAHASGLESEYAPRVWLAALASTLQVFGIAVALGAVFMRARFLRSPLDLGG